MASKVSVYADANGKNVRQTQENDKYKQKVIEEIRKQYEQSQLAYAKGDVKESEAYKAMADDRRAKEGWLTDQEKKAKQQMQMSEVKPTTTKSPMDILEAPIRGAYDYIFGNKKKQTKPKFEDEE